MSTPAAKSPEQLYHQLQSAVRAVDQFSVKTVLEELDRRKLDLATLDKKLYPTKQVPLVFSALQDECRCRFVDLPKVGCSGLEIVRLLVERGLPCSHPDHPFVDLFAEVIIHNKIRMGDFGGQNEHDARENELCKCLKFLLNMDFRPAYPHLLESLIMLVHHQQPNGIPRQFPPAKAIRLLIWGGLDPLAEDQPFNTPDYLHGKEGDDKKYDFGYKQQQSAKFEGSELASATSLAESLSREGLGDGPRAGAGKPGAGTGKPGGGAGGGGAAAVVRDKDGKEVKAETKALTAEEAKQRWHAEVSPFTQPGSVRPARTTDEINADWDQLLWRATLKPGDQLDVFDNPVHRRSEVISVHSTGRSSAAITSAEEKSRDPSSIDRRDEKERQAFIELINNRSIVVHYHGWRHKWNETVRVNSVNLQPFLSNWRPTKEHCWGKTAWARAKQLSDRKLPTVLKAIEAGLADLAQRRKDFVTRLQKAIQEHSGRHITTNVLYIVSLYML